MWYMHAGTTDEHPYLSTAVEFNVARVFNGCGLCGLRRPADSSNRKKHLFNINYSE